MDANGSKQNSYHMTSVTSRVSETVFPPRPCPSPDQDDLTVRCAPRRAKKGSARCNSGRHAASTEVNADGAEAHSSAPVQAAAAVKSWIAQVEYGTLVRTVGVGGENYPYSDSDLEY
jgi:hypothetical protein